MWQITMPIALPAFPFIISQDLVPSPHLQKPPPSTTLTSLHFFVNVPFIQLHLTFNIMLVSGVQHNC